MLLKPFKAKLAIIPSFILGATPALVFMIFGKIMNEHTKYLEDSSYPALDKILTWSLIALGVGVISAACKFIAIFSWTRIGSRFTTNLKGDLFKSMMRSDVSFFDVESIGAILTLLSEDSELVQEAFGSTKNTQIGNFSQFLLGMILIYVYSWKIGLVTCILIPIIYITIAVFSIYIDRHVIRKFKYVAESMTIAEETLAAIRTVRGFNRERQETARFMNETLKARGQDRWINGLVCAMFTVVCTIQFIIISLNLYWGGEMIQEGTLEAGNLMSIFAFMMFGIFGLMDLQASLQGEQKAIASGGRILDLTHRQPAINFDGGETITDFKGNIEFRNVSFKYPTRDVYVLKNVSFEIKAGQMGALVGHSGSGKSTCIQLLERFYDATEGVILLDGKDIRTLDPRWLHSKMALVAQEPSLFQMTVKDNIKYGKMDATDAEVEAAAEIANAKKFIMKMEKGFDQMVGEKGSTVSGGQRQRIAIARAVIRDPVILLTDEATSALDAESEKKVQIALDKVMENRTAVIVAHRLSTIRNAHIIYVFDSGEIKEVGTHDSLVEKKGFYYELVRRQLTQKEIDAIENDNQKSE